jgi:hypothetical protein
MFPWLWFWAPQFHYPFSGSVAQHIDPDTSWFFAGIPSQAGNGAIEKKAFDLASYGSQLGWITEVLLADDPKADIAADKAAEARDKLRKAHRKIEDMKKQSKAEVRQNAEAALKKLREADPDAYEAVLAIAPKRLRGAP